LAVPEVPLWDGSGMLVAGEKMAKITFLGGVGTVTGSKYLIEADNTKVLVDCGMFQGLAELRQRNWEDPPFDPASIDAVIITHAHIDHTGYLPRLVKLGFKGPVFTSKATRDLMKILLPDAARLQEEEADYRNRHQLTSHSPALPLYGEAEARDALALINGVDNDGVLIEIASGVRAGFSVAGHIMGASMVLVEIAGAQSDDGPMRFLFSGDLGHYEQPIVRDPAAPPDCDYLMCESTYGDREHGDERSDIQLARLINEAARKGGPILIPAFAVGRTQEILYMLRQLEDQERIPSLPVIVDSPMAAQATAVYSRSVLEHDAEYASILATKTHPLRTDWMRTASSREESKRLNQMKGPRIIISASGMMTGGRVLHHAMRVLPDENATVIFVGYQAAGTTGRRLVEGATEVKVMKQWIKVRCAVEKVEGFSAHADWRAVIKWLEGLRTPPRKVFTTHGEPESAEAMANHIRKRFGWVVEVPTLNQTVEL